MSIASKAVIGVALSCLAGPVLGESLPADVLGSWDVSADECRGPGTSMTRIDIRDEAIDTYGGDAAVEEVSRSGPVTFVAADFLQREGAVELGERERVYFRLTQRDGRDRLNFIWKDVRTVDLVRCDSDTARKARLARSPMSPGMADATSSTRPALRPTTTG